MSEFNAGTVAGIIIGLVLGVVALLIQYHYKNVTTSKAMIAQAILLCENHGGLAFMEKDGDLYTYYDLIAGCSSGVEISFRSEE